MILRVYSRSPLSLFLPRRRFLFFLRRIRWWLHSRNRLPSRRVPGALPPSPYVPCRWPCSWRRRNERCWTRTWGLRITSLCISSRAAAPVSLCLCLWFSEPAPDACSCSCSCSCSSPPASESASTLGHPTQLSRKRARRGLDGVSTAAWRHGDTATRRHGDTATRLAGGGSRIQCVRRVRRTAGGRALGRLPSSCPWRHTASVARPGGRSAS